MSKTNEIVLDRREKRALVRIDAANGGRLLIGYPRGVSARTVASLRAKGLLHCREVGATIRGIVRARSLRSAGDGVAGLR